MLLADLIDRANAIGHHAIIALIDAQQELWINADDIPHLVSEKDGKFRSSALDTNDKFSQTFSTAGTVEYFCAIHPHMTGKILVTP